MAPLRDVGFGCGALAADAFAASVARRGPALGPERHLPIVFPAAPRAAPGNARPLQRDGAAPGATADSAAAAASRSSWPSSHFATVA